jgi:hypothetical protein
MIEGGTLRYSQLPRTTGGSLVEPLGSLIGDVVQLIAVDVGVVELLRVAAEVAPHRPSTVGRLVLCLTHRRQRRRAVADDSPLSAEPRNLPSLTPSCVRVTSPITIGAQRTFGSQRSDTARTTKQRIAFPRIRPCAHTPTTCADGPARQLTGNGLTDQLGAGARSCTWSKWTNG